MNQNVVVSFLARNADFIRGARQVTGHLSAIDRAQKAVAKTMVGAGVATVGSYLAMAKGSATFEANMRNVNSIVKTSEFGFRNMSNEVLKLSTELPRSAANLAEGAYNVASAGFTGAAEVTSVLEAAAKGAAAGLTDTNISATALTTTLNAYGMGAGEAMRVSDILFKTVDAGQISYEQLATQLSDFVGMAKASGATIEETFATFAQITIATGNAARAGTGMAGIFRSMIKPSEDLTNQLDELYGMTGQQAIQAHGLTKVLQDLEKATNGDATAMAALFPDTEALNGVLAFLSQNAGDTAANLDAFRRASEGVGVTQMVLNEQSKSFSYQLEQMKASLGAAATVFGRVLLPVLKGSVGVVTFLARTFMDLPEPVKTAITYLGLAAGILTGLGGVMMIAGTYTKLLGLAWGLLQKAMANSAIGGAATQIAGYTRNTQLAGTASEVAAARINSAKTAMLKVGKAAGTAGLAYMAFAAANDFLQSKLNPQNLTAMEKSLLDLSRGEKISGEMAKQFGDDIENLADKLERTKDISGGEWLKQGLFGGKKDPLGVGGMDEDIDSLDKALTNLYMTNPDQAIRAFDIIKAKLDAAGVSASQIDEAFNDYKGAVAGASLEQDKAAGTSGELATQLAMVEAGAAGAGSQMSALDRLTRGMTEAQRSFASAIQSGYSGIGGALQGAIEGQRRLRSGAKKEAKQESKSDPIGDALKVRQAVLGIEQATNQLADAEEELARIRSTDPAERVAEAEGDLQKAYDSVERAVRGVKEAEKALAEIRDRDLAQDIIVLERDVAGAYDNTRRAEMALEDAHRDLEEARKPSAARSIEEAEIAIARAIMNQAEAAQELVHAQNQLAEAQDHGTPEELAESERRLTEARFREREAVWAVEDAQSDLNKVRGSGNQARMIEEAEMGVREAERAVAEAQRAAQQTQKDLNDLRQNGYADELAEAEIVLRDAIRGVAEADQAAAKAAEDLYKVRSENNSDEVRDAELRVREAILGVDEAHHRLAETQRGEVGSAADEVVEDLDSIEIGLDELGAHLRQNIEEHKQWLIDLQTIHGKFGPAVAAIMAQMGEDGRKATRELAAGTKEDGAQMARDLEANAILGSEAFNSAIVRGLSTGKENAKQITQQTVAAIAQELGIGKAEAERILDELGISYSNFAKTEYKDVGGGQYRMYVPGKGFVGATLQADGTEDHRAQIAPAGAWRVWAEEETGGEAYIPLAPSKRRRSSDILKNVANRFGYQLEGYAEGGIRVPMRQAFSARGAHDMQAVAGEKAAIFSVEKLFKNYVAAAAAVPMNGDMTGNLVDIGHQIEAMGFRVSEHPAFGGVDPVHSTNSYHYKGRAIDVNFYPANQEPSRLDQLAAHLRATVGGIKELLWRTEGHFNHLHLAMANGGVLKGMRQATFDSGGYLEPGYTLAYNGTGKRELISTADGRGPGGGTVTLARGAVQVTVRAEAGVDESRLAAMVGEKVETGVRSAVSTIHRELRRN